MELRTRTVGDVVSELARACGHDGAADLEWLADLCWWPPNAFALAALVLGESGAYRRCVSPPANGRWPPKDPPEWLDELNQAARDWRSRLGTDATDPRELKRLLAAVVAGGSTPLRDLADSGETWNLVSALLELLALADATSAGVGFGAPPTADIDQQSFISVANDLLAERGSLCDAPVDYLRVLAKRHTPQSGLSMRSLSLNLAMVRGEVATHWQVASTTKLRRKERMNLLIVPWPAEITPAAFSEVEPDRAEKALKMDSRRFGFFNFTPCIRGSDGGRTLRSTRARSTSSLRRSGSPCVTWSAKTSRGRTPSLTRSEPSDRRSSSPSCWTDHSFASAGPLDTRRSSRMTRAARC